MLLIATTTRAKFPIIARCLKRHMHPSATPPPAILINKTRSCFFFFMFVTVVNESPSNNRSSISTFPRKHSTGQYSTLQPLKYYETRRRIYEAHCYISRINKAIRQYEGARATKTSALDLYIITGFYLP